MDKEIFTKAIQGYVKDPKKNIPNLMVYAKAGERLDWGVVVMSIFPKREEINKKNLLLLRNIIREFIKEQDVNISIGYTK